MKDSENKKYYEKEEGFTERVGENKLGPHLGWVGFSENTFNKQIQDVAG